ncbi:MAG TPA: hypothetical protein VFT22_09735 [Kofleriaceae bacterium]|nr:hypothetical protein [Kofleriaceae bacterium]
MCTDALEEEPECLPLLLIRARAHIALRRDLEAQADLRDIIRLDPRCGTAYRLLGELAARADENQPAALFFREAIRLNPADREAHDWLAIVDASLRPVAGAATLPATAAATGRGSSPVPASQTRGLAGAKHRDPPPPVRIPRGTQPPEHIDAEERPTKPLGCSADRDDWRTPRVRSTTPPLTLPRNEVAPPKPTLTGRPPTQPPAKEAPRLAPRTTRATARPQIPELPGFGEYLVAQGILTRERLRAAQAYQRSMKVQLSTAIVTLGLASPQRIEWAAVAHQSELAELNRERQSS